MRKIINSLYQCRWQQLLTYTHRITTSLIPPSSSKKRRRRDFFQAQTPWWQEASTPALRWPMALSPCLLMAPYPSHHRTSKPSILTVPIVCTVSNKWTENLLTIQWPSEARMAPSEALSGRKAHQISLIPVTLWRTSTKLTAIARLLVTLTSLRGISDEHRKTMLICKIHND